MRYRFILILAILLLSACSTESIVDSDAKTNAIGALKTNPTAAEIAANENADTESVSDEANKLLETLTVKFEKARSKWIEKNARIKDSRERQAHFESRPCLKYADQLVKMAEKYPDTEAAKLAWPIAAKFGMGESKFKASDAVLAAAIAEADPAKSMESLEFLMKYTFGDPQKKAMELMLSRAMEHKDPESAFDIIKKIVCSPRGMVTFGDVVLPSGNQMVREKAIKQLWGMVEADVKSETAIECLNLIYENGSGKTNDDAIALLFKHHAAHAQTMKIIQGLRRQVTAKSENWIKQAVEYSDEKVKINAVIALCRFYSKKQHSAQYYESAPPIHLQGLGEERAAYLKTKIDPAEFTRLEEMLTTYVKTTRGDGHGDLLEAARKELFALQNLAVGKQAPEIVSADFDGVEFKLSDYRGKIVFVDFWGDW